MRVARGAGREEQDARRVVQDVGRVAQDAEANLEYRTAE
jgi:hypothetical protein